MDPAAYTTASNEAGQRYVIVLAAFRALLFSYMSMPFSEASMRKLRDEATGITETYARTETTLIRDALTDTAQNAQRSAWSDLGASGRPETPDAHKAFLEQSVEHLTLEVGAQLARDVETLVRVYRECAMEAQLKTLSNGSVRPVMAEQDRVRFYFLDRAGRATPSQRFIRVAWRLSMVSLGAEFYLLAAVAAGATSCVVQHADPDHRWHGTMIDLGNGRGGEPFHELRTQIFHPMTESFLKASR